MAFFRLVLYSSKLNRIHEKLTAEKNAGAAITKREKPKYGWRLKLSHVWINCKRRLSYCLINLYFLRNTAFDRFIYRLRKYGSFENYVLKSIIGFFCGYMLTYLLFLFLALQLNVGLSVATIICSIMGCILTIGLAFSQNIRCIVLLTLPQFFSKRGRQALIAYALIITLTGPTRNTLNNMGIMSESLACGQEQLKSAVKQILDVIKKPFVAIKDALKSVVKAVKEVIKKIKEILLRIKRLVMAILGVIKSVYEFLGRVLNLCNKELGTPYQRCSRVFETAIADCQASLGAFFSWACSIGYLLEAVCYVVKPFDLICLLVDFLSNSIIGVVMRKIKIFIRHVKTMFYVKIKFSHSYHFESKSSKSMKEIANNIVGEVKTRTRGIVSVLAFFNCAASLFLIFLIFKVIHYRHNYLTKERFDNKYLTSNLVDIDLRRAAMEKETIFPLNHRERKKYITIKSVRLLPKERKELAESLGFLMSTSLKIGTHMAIDYSLFWMMNLIRKYGKFQSKVQAPNMPTAHIAGEGLLADLLRAIVKSFQPIGISLEVDTVPCLPIPIPPDFDRYIQIASILLVCLLLTLLEPYGLRWRNWILCYYYPRRAKERAVWLYNHILRSRGSFLKFARRQLRRKVLGSNKVSKVTCLEYLRSRTNNKCLLLFLGSDKQEACLLCGEVFRQSDEVGPIKCQRPGCTAIYCKQCFEDLENICTVCLSPIEYGDMSDFSEERDSSDEDFPRPPKPSIDPDGFDSGMTSDSPTEEDEGSTDDYSYAYQEKEKLPDDMINYRMDKNKDMDKEKQRSQDYVSMQYFDEEIELYSLKAFDNKDEETQYPEESLSSLELDKESVPKEAFDSSSVDSSFKDHIKDMKGDSQESCRCFEINEIEEYSSKHLLEELKQKVSSTVMELKHFEFVPPRKNEQLKTISELTEDEALIQFSSDEEKEKESTLDKSDQGSFISQGHLSQPEAYKLASPKDFSKKTESVDVVNQFSSDSEFSENDVKKLIGTNVKEKKPLIQESSTQSWDFKTSRTTSQSESTPSEVSETTGNTSPRKTIPSDLSDGGSSMESEKVKRTKYTEAQNLSDKPTQETQQRHIEFIGVQQKNQKRKSKITDSSSGEETTPKRSIANYKSTVSTKTSKQDVPSHLKDRKSILRETTGSSILSEIKQLKGREPVPRLNLESLEKSEIKPTTSDLNETYSKSSMSRPSTANRISTDKHRKLRKTNKTEKRLKGGGNFSLLISPCYTKKFPQENPEVERVSSYEYPWSQDSSSPHYPFQSFSNNFTSSIYSNSDGRNSRIDSTNSNLKRFESSDTSISVIVSDKSDSSISTSISDEIETQNSNRLCSTIDAMATDNNSTQQSIDKSHSHDKSDENLSAQKNTGTSKNSGDTEETTDENQLGETDASSDLSISVQENILGIPRRKLKRKQKTDWTQEKEIHSDVSEEDIVEKKLDSTRVKRATQKTVKTDSDSPDPNSKNSKETTSEHTFKITTSSNELIQQMSIGDQNPSIQNVGSPTTQNISDKGKGMEPSEKFVMPENSSKIMESRISRGCKCCKCLEKLPIVHDSPGGDPNRRIMLQTGVDSSTQTSIDCSERSLQIGCPCESTLDGNSAKVCKDGCRVKCKFKTDGIGYNYLEKPEQHCVCSDERGRMKCKLKINGDGFNNLEKPEIHHGCSSEKCRVKCKLKTDGDSHSDLEKPGKHCVCSACCRLINHKKEDITTQKKCSLPKRKTTGTICKPTTRNQTCCTNDEICTSCRDKLLPHQDSTDSSSSKEESYRERLELPFQDNDEYKKLVRELEEKLVARNRERVRKTMREFEKCSKRNENLRRPILYDDSSCGEEPILTKLVNLKTGDDDLSCSDRRTQSPKRRHSIKNDNKTMQGDFKGCRLPPRKPNYYYERDSMHWQMDNQTGEWYRVSDLKICDTFGSYEPDLNYHEPVERANVRMMERYEVGGFCEACDALNRRYGHRYNILSCPRHRLDRFRPRHRKR